MGETTIWDRSLTDDEITELFGGPEPTNSAVPTISGTEQQGETLTCTTGTWASISNGTLAYAYQWYRADDNLGTNEQAISGATASAHALTRYEAGKRVRCKVRSSNDGDHDPGEDAYTAYTGIVAELSTSLAANCGDFTCSLSDVGEIQKCFNLLFGVDQHSPDPYLKFRLKMDDDAADSVVADSGEAGLNFTLNGGETTAIKQQGSGQFGYAFLLNGADDYLNAALSTGVEQELTYGIWIKPATVTGGEDYIMGTQNGTNDGARYLRYDNTQIETDAIGDTTQSVSVASTVTLNTWQQYTVRFDADLLELFKDGTLIGSEDVSDGAFAASLSNFTIGRRPDSASGYFSGQMAEGWCFYRKLTDAEIGEVVAGPEPISTVAPTVSGTAKQGSDA